MKIFWRVMLLLVAWSVAGHAQSSNPELREALKLFSASGDFEAIKPEVLEMRTFYGLASYYNAVSFFRLNDQGLELLEPGQSVTLSDGDLFAAVGRFKVLTIDSPGVELEIAEETFRVITEPPFHLDATVVRKDKLGSLDEALDQLRYHHLWWPFAQLARATEWSLLEIRERSGYGWGLCIVIFTVLLKILLIPLAVFATRMQGQTSQIQAQLAPKMAEIKSKYDGEEAHKRIMAAHKDLGVSTFFALKPLLATFIQVPVWVAVFNALGEMPQLSHWGFLWIEYLAYPDSIAMLPMTLPLFGNSLSLLPILMTVVTIVSALLFQDRHAPADELKRQKRNLYLMALAFLVLFYPFPAAMVLYWTLSNALQIVQQRFVRA
ncbi:MAG: YidC/Oxa1 family membrane protein insertase [Halioglobus sp.]|jgi:YidC/Oxa1 family membrane protein insertase